MTKLRLLLTMLVVSICSVHSAWADVEINETNFPDANFRSYLLSEDYGSDGVITDEEIANISFITVDGKSIQSLNGIEFFTALKYLFCYNNQLTALDVSKNTALTSLSCYSNQLASLDVSGCSALTSLSCYSNQLASLDVSGCSALTSLSCSNNQLASLDVSGCSALTSLSCYSNQLTSLDVTKNTKLTYLGCYQNQIKGAAMDALIESLPVVTKGYMYVIHDWDEGNVMLKKQVAAAKAKGWTPLYYNGTEYAGSESAVQIDATNFPDENFRNFLLSQSYGSDGKLTESEIAGIIKMSLNYKNISDLTGIEYFTALTHLECDNNQLTALDLSKNTALTNLSCEINQLTALDLSKNTALTTLYCYINQLTALDVSGCTALTSLYCYDNQLTTLDVSKSTALTRLECEDNQLTALDVSMNTALNYLSCYTNQLTALDVSKNTALTHLYCYNNQLTALDVSKNTALRYLYCYQNQIKGAAMDAFIASLPENANDCTLRIIYNENEGNTMTAAQVEAARAKGWQPLAYDAIWYAYLGSDVPVPEPVEINETNFPDEIFRNYVSSKFDKNHDGKLSFYEGQRGDMEPDEGGIKSLKGIEFFTEIEGLYCHGNELTTLDLSKNTQLKEVKCQNNQIRGAGMDALVENLPTTKNAKLYIVNQLPEFKLSGGLTFTYIYDGNVMTAAQVAVAKAKGWTPYHCVSRDEFGKETWVPYEGNGSTALQPITEETTVAFGVYEIIDLSNTAMNDVLCTLDNTAGNGYDDTDQSIIVVSTMNADDVAGAETLAPGTPEFAEKFNGITIELAAGFGSVTIDCQTLGNRLLNVKIGNNPAKTYSKSERGEVNVAYNVMENTFMYIYATAVAGSRGSELTAIENALKLYGFTVKPGDTTAIEGIESDTSASKNGSDVYFDLSGRRVTAPTKGVYVKNGRKVAIK